MLGEDREVKKSGQKGAEDWENWESAVILNQGKNFKKEAVSAHRAAELLGMMRMEKCPWDPERASVIPARSISEASWVDYSGLRSAYLRYWLTILLVIVDGKSVIFFNSSFIFIPG